MGNDGSVDGGDWEDNTARTNGMFDDRTGMLKLEQECWFVHKKGRGAGGGRLD